MLKLIQNLGIGKAKKFFPIIAKDIDSELIEKNKQVVIGLRSSIDIPKAEKCLIDSNVNISDVIESTQLAPEKVSGTYNYEISQYKIKGILKGAVKFEKADIVEDTAKNFPKDSVVLFRNAVPYLKPEQEQQLVKNLRKNLPANSLVVIGGFDQDYSYFAEHLSKSSFDICDKDNPMISRCKKLKWEFPLGVQYKENPLIAGLFLKKNVSEKLSKVGQLLAKLKR